MISPFKILGILFILIITGCTFGFKGISIPPEAKTFYVENFTLSSNDVPVDLNLEFTEELRRKVREETRLVADQENPHIVFTGQVNAYRVSFVAPDDNNSISLNRLEIRVKINYENTFNEEENWSKTYSDFEDFDSNTNIQDVRDELIDVIIEDILERVFNDAFTNW